MPGLKIFSLLCVLVLGLAAAPVRADFAQGQRQFAGGDFAGAYDLWYEAAAAFDVDAMFSLAGLYETGRGVEQDLLSAAILYRMSEALGRPEALQHFERLVQEVTSDLPRVDRLGYLIQIFNRRLSQNIPLIRAHAEAGNTNAQFVYGALLAEGIGVARANHFEGYKWLTIAQPQLIGEVAASHVTKSLAHLAEDLGDEVIVRARAQAASFSARSVPPVQEVSAFHRQARFGFFDTHDDYIVAARRLMRAAILPMFRTALAGPAFVAIHANGGLEKFDALKISFPSGNERFTSDALHRGASDELVIPVDFLRLLRNANDAAIEVQRAVDCNIGVVPGPLRGDCDGAERLERFLDQVSHAASNDLRRGSRDVIAPLIRFDSAFAIERDETEYSVSLNPAAVRGFNFASSLAVVVAHELGHIFAASGFDIGPDGRPGDIERKVDGFATRLLLETDGGVLNFSITSVRAAMLTLEVGGLATFDCQAAVFGAVQNDGPSQACRLE